MRVYSEIRRVERTRSETVIQQIIHVLDGVRANGMSVLRWGLIALSSRDFLIELALLNVVSPAPPQTWHNATRNATAIGRLTIAIVVPTGVGAAFGGFVGDACPIVKLFEQVADTVIVHPNVVNGADFYGASGSSWYLDGLTLDRFLMGEIGLRRDRALRIGLLVDRLNDCSLDKLINAANAVRAVYGVDVVGFSVCKEKLRSVVEQTPYGHFNGSIENPDVLLDAADVLKNASAEAIAVVSSLEGTNREQFTAHYQGAGVNPIGAVESLISRLVTFHTQLPCAHAPAELEKASGSHGVIDPRAAAEAASATGLPCVMIGLARSPTIDCDSGISIHDMTAVLVPEGCAGGVPAMAALHHGFALLGIRGNQCAVGASLAMLEIPTAICLDSYAEAAAWLLARRAGISWESISRPLSTVRQIR